MSHTGTRLRRTVQTAAAFGIAAALLTGCASSAAEAGADDADSVQPGGSRVFVDELGREVEIDLPVTAVYTDYIYQAEAVRLVGGNDLIVAQGEITDPSSPLNSNNKTYLESFAGAVNVGPNDAPNWEAIVDSGAELAFVMRNGPYQDAIEKLEPFGIDVFVVTGWDPKVLREYIPVLGEILGTEEQAAEAAAFFDDIDATLTEGLDGLSEDEKRTVYYENNAEYATGVPGSGWHDVIVDGGGVNIFGDVKVSDDQSAKVHSYPVDPVEVINRDPEVIIHNGVDGLSYGYEVWPEDRWQGQAQAIADRGGWDQISAVKDGEVYVTNNFFYSSLGKKIGSVWIAKTLYPERFENVEVDDFFGQWLELQGVDPVPSSDYVRKIAG